jgi:PAS domain-containing protein
MIDSSSDLVAAWEEDSTHAFILATFEPATMRRTAISANPRAAALLGMHREELLARYAQHDVPLALPPLDALRHLLHALRHGAFDPASMRYHRMLVDGGRGVALVCTQTVRIFDDRRRICQVRTARARLRCPRMHSVSSYRCAFNVLRCFSLFPSLSHTHANEPGVAGHRA